MRLSPRNSDPEKALRVASAFFWAIMKRGAAMAGRHTNPDAGAADLSACASTLDQIAYDGKHAGFSEDQTHNTSKKMDYPVTVMQKEELRSLIQTEIRSAVEAVKQV